MESQEINKMYHNKCEQNKCGQTITLSKMIDRYGREQFFVNENDFDIDKVIIGKMTNCKKSKELVCDDLTKTIYYKHELFYIYYGDIELGTAIINPLRLYCSNLKLRNDRPYIVPFSENIRLRYIKLPLDVSNKLPLDISNTIDTNIPTDSICITPKMEEIIRSIKLKLIQNINTTHKNMISEESIDKMIKSSDDSINVLVTSLGDLETKVVRLGSASTNYTNIKVKTLKDLQSLIRDQKYNKQADDSRYICNTVLTFNSFVTVKRKQNEGISDIESEHIESKHISFRALIDVMEMYYNKSKWISILNPHDKIVVFDNTLVL